MYSLRAGTGGAHRAPRAAGLGPVLLLLGLLLMHFVGLDHSTPRGAEPNAGTHAQAHQHGASAAPAAVSDHGPGDTGGMGGCAEDGCGMEMAMAGLCIVALLGGGIFVHLAARALRPVPGRGLPAPPLWRPLPAVPLPPSLARLSISRT